MSRFIESTVAQVMVELNDDIMPEHVSMISFGIFEALDKIVKRGLGIQTIGKDIESIMASILVVYEDLYDILNDDLHIKDKLQFIAISFYDILYYKYKEINGMKNNMKETYSQRAKKAWDTRRSNQAKIAKEVEVVDQASIYRERGLKAAATRKANKEREYLASLSPQQRAWITRRAKANIAQ